MSDKPWKKFERDSGDLIGGKRYPANLGEKVDVEGPYFVGQCKQVKNMSLNALCELVEMVNAERDDKFGVVMVSNRPGAGRKATRFVAVPWDTFAILVKQGGMSNAQT